MEVSAINPMNSIGAIENKELQIIANEVSDKLKDIIERMWFFIIACKGSVFLCCSRLNLFGLCRKKCKNKN